MSVLIRSRRLVADGKVGPGAVLIEGERIKSLLPVDAAPPGAEIHDAGDLVVMAGLVDSHVHVNEPGRAEWEGFETATEAALAGGITTIVDMPLNCIPVTTTASAFDAKIEAMENKLRVDCGAWGGVIPHPENASELELMARAGARGFKAFLCDSGIPEFPACTEKDLRRAMTVLAKLGLPLLVHAELCLDDLPPKGGPDEYSRYVGSRPPSWEVAAVELVARLCAETRCRAHIVHLAAADALPVIERAKKAGAPLTVETCPHYLTFAAEDVPRGRTEYKCAPPIRSRENRERLWKAVMSGAIDMVVSDHSPCLPALKQLEKGDFEKAWGGVAGLQFTLPATWTGFSARGGGLPAFSRLISERPARLAGLAQKGRLEPGFDADLVIWDPGAAGVVGPKTIRHRHKLTPYTGRTLRGAVRSVWLRGAPAFDGARPVGPRRGAPLLAKENG
jgi:allantoinase